MRVLLLTGVGDDCVALESWLRHQPGVADVIATTRPVILPRTEHIVSYRYRHIVPTEVLESVKSATNIHTGLLPFSRGADPHLWAVLEGRQVGASIHKMAAGIDTGDILWASGFYPETWQTLGGVKAILRAMGLDMFKSRWPKIAAGTARAVPQGPSNFPTMRTSDRATLETRLGLQFHDEMTVEELQKIGAWLRHEN